MASIQSILQPTYFKSYGDLHRALRKLSAELRTCQVDAIADGCETMLPEDVALHQRTPKGTVYVYIDGEHVFSVDQRGREST